jgi:hypothetical protein
VSDYELIDSGFAVFDPEAVLFHHLRQGRYRVGRNTGDSWRNRPEARGVFGEESEAEIVLAFDAGLINEAYW